MYGYICRISLFINIGWICAGDAICCPYPETFNADSGCRQRVCGFTGPSPTPILPAFCTKASWKCFKVSGGVKVLDVLLALIKLRFVSIMLWSWWWCWYGRVLWALILSADDIFKSRGLSLSLTSDSRSLFLSLTCFSLVFRTCVSSLIGVCFSVCLSESLPIIDSIVNPFERFTLVLGSIDVAVIFLRSVKFVFGINNLTGSKIEIHTNQRRYAITEWKTIIPISQFTYLHEINL